MGRGADHGHGHGEVHGDFRSKVWSMPGGPYCRPKHWKRNTAVAMFGVFLICIPIAMKSAELEIFLFHGGNWKALAFFTRSFATLKLLGITIMLNSWLACNDRIILFARSLPSSGARTLELRTIE